MLQDMEDGEVGTLQLNGFVPSFDPVHEGFVFNSDVSYCAMRMPSLHYSDPDSDLIPLGLKFLMEEFVRPKVRLAGSSYGLSAMYSNSLSGIMLLSHASNPLLACGGGWGVR